MTENFLIVVVLLNAAGRVAIEARGVKRQAIGLNERATEAMDRNCECEDVLQKRICKAFPEDIDGRNPYDNI